MQNLRRCVPQALMYSSRPKARTAHIAPVRLADENLLFSGLRNLMRGVAQDLEYSSRPQARTAHVDSARLAHQNPLLVGGGTSSAAFRGARRKGRFVSGGSRAVRTFGVHLVRIGPVRLARENLLLAGCGTSSAELMYD